MQQSEKKRVCLSKRSLLEVEGKLDVLSVDCAAHDCTERLAAAGKRSMFLSSLFCHCTKSSSHKEDVSEGKKSVREQSIKKGRKKEKPQDREHNRLESDYTQRRGGRGVDVQGKRQKPVHGEQKKCHEEESF